MKLPQLHLRDLFWLVVVIGVAIMWWFDHIDLKIGGGMCEESRRAMMATMDRMKLAMENKGYRWEPSSQTMVENESS